jgi:hypothetical protein
MMGRKIISKLRKNNSFLEKKNYLFFQGGS